MRKLYLDMFLNTSRAAANTLTLRRGRWCLNFLCLCFQIEKSVFLVEDMYLKYCQVNFGNVSISKTGKVILK